MTAQGPTSEAVATSPNVLDEAGQESLLRELQAELEGLRERMVIVETAAELGIIEYDLRGQLILLDAAAAALHGIVDPDAGPMMLDAWLALLAQEDQLRAHTLLRSGVPDGQTERMTVHLPGVDPRKPRLLELSLRAAPRSQRLVGTCRDVTRERSLEALRRQKAAAERANQAKSEYHVAGQP